MDGTVQFRSGERINFSYLISEKQINDSVSPSFPAAHLWKVGPCAGADMLACKCRGRQHMYCCLRACVTKLLRRDLLLDLLTQGCLTAGHVVEGTVPHNQIM